MLLHRLLSGTPEQTFDIAEQNLLAIFGGQKSIFDPRDYSGWLIDGEVRPIEYAVGADFFHSLFKNADPFDTGARDVDVCVLVARDDLDARSYFVPAAAEMWKHDRDIGKAFGQAAHLFGGGMDLDDQIQLAGELHHLSPLRRVIAVLSHVVAEFTEPYETELFVALLDFAQCFINAKWSNDAATAKASFVLLRVLSYFTITEPVILGRSSNIATG